MKIQCAMLVTALCLACVVSAEAANVRATLIEATRESDGTDRRIAGLESKLRRVFGFEGYTFIDEKRASVSPGQSVTISLSGGNVVTMDAAGSERSLNADVSWRKGKKKVISTRIQLVKRSPVVLGGVNHGNGKLIVVLTSE